MEAEGEGYDPENIIIKDEPLSDDTYGIMSSSLQASNTNDCQAVLKSYPPEASESSADDCDVKYSSYHEEPSSSEADDYNVMSMSYSDTGDASEDVPNGRDGNGHGKAFGSKEGDSFQVFPAGDDSSDEEDAHLEKGEDAEDVPSGDTEDDKDESGIGMTIKEERDDDGYDFAYTCSTDLVKEEVPSPETVPTFEQDRTYMEQEDQSEDDNSHDKTCEKEISEPRRTKRMRHKAKRRDSFEYEDDDDDSTPEELAKPLSLVQNRNMPVENVSLTAAEFEDYMDTDREQNERRKEEGGEGRQDKRPVTEIQDDYMIAQYAIFDPQKSEMVGIKSVNPKKCQICDKEFQYEFHMKFHMQQVHPEALENDKRKNEPDGPLWERMQGHNPRARYSKTCFICMNKVYTHPYYLNLHMQEMHPEWLIDNKMIQSLTADDETDYSQPENKNKVCPVCFEGFRFAFQLKYHIQKKHAEILVEDKRFDTSKLPSRIESEFPIEDANATRISESVRPSVSAISSGGIKLTYTVKDLLNIKQNLEKEKAAKEAKEAQRLAKSLEPKKKPGRPPKSAEEKMGKTSHIHKTTILRRGPGRPRKNPDAQKDKKLGVKLSTKPDKSESVSKSDKNFEAASLGPVLQVTTSDGTFMQATISDDTLSQATNPDGSICDIQIKEEPVSDDEDRTSETDQSQLQMEVDEPNLVQRKMYEDEHSVNSVHRSEKKTHDGHQFDVCDSVNKSPTTLAPQYENNEKDVQDDKAEEVLHSNASTNVISFEGEKHLMSSNARLEFNLKIAESNSSRFALTDSFQERFTNETEKLNIKREKEQDEMNDEHMPAENKPKRRRKKKELKDMLPYIVASKLSPPKKKRKKVETEGHKEPKADVGKQTGNKNTKTKTPKIPGSSSKKTNPKTRVSRSKKKNLQTLHVNAQQNRFCSTCGKIFSSLQTFKDHKPACLSRSLEDQSPPGYYPCQHCSVVFHHVAAYQLHKLTEHLDSSRTCPFCGKLFAYKSVMKKHMYIHTNETVKKAITALKDTSAKDDVTMDKDSKLVGLITSLGVQGEIKSDTPDSQSSALQVSVPFKSVSSPADSLKSLPTVLSSEDCPKAENFKTKVPAPSKEMIAESPSSKEQEISNTDKSESSVDSSKERSNIKNLSPVSTKNPLPYAASKEELSDDPQTANPVPDPRLLSDVPSWKATSLSVTASSASSSPQSNASLVKTASTSLASSTTGSDVESSISSIASKLPFPLCPAITSLLVSQTPSSAASSSSSSVHDLSTLATSTPTIASTSTETSSVTEGPAEGLDSDEVVAAESAETTSSLTNPSAETSSASSTASPSLFAQPVSMISSSSVKSRITPSVLNTSSASSLSPPTASPASTSRLEHFSIKIYPCKNCNAEFPNIALLYKHELGQHLKHVCPHCKKGFAYEAVLKKHVLIHQSNPTKFNCIWCGRVFSYLNRFKDHIATHNGTVSSHKLNCNKCTKAWFDIGGKLPIEVKDCIGDHLKDCFEEAAGDMDEMLNSYLSLGAKNESQKCLECDKSYMLDSKHSRNLMISHVYKCKICDKDFPDTDLLKGHVFEHHNEAKGLVSSYKQNRSFNCGSCSKKFPSLFNFMCHMTAHKNAFRAEQSGNSGIQGMKPS